MIPFVDGFYRGCGCMVGIAFMSLVMLGIVKLIDRLNPDLFTLD